MDHEGLRRLAAAQHGAFSRTQAAGLGFDRWVVSRRLRTGDWAALSPRVLCVAGSPATNEQRAMAATLDVLGSAVSHESSGGMWGIPGFRLEPLHVVQPVGPHRMTSPLCQVHTSTHLPASHRAMLHGIPVTTPVRTLFDLAPRVHPLRMPRLVDAAWAMRLVSGELLHAALEDHAQRGRPGIQLMREILADRPVTYRPPDSNLEARFQDIARSAGVATLRRQVETGGDSWVGRVDFRDQVLPLVIEIDSERFHGSLTARADDEVRRQRLIDAGFVVRQIPEFDVWHRPAVVRRQLIDARSLARARR